MRNPGSALFPSPCKGEDEGEGPFTARIFRARFKILPLLSIALLALSSPALAQPCLPAFPYRTGWVGGDGASSIPLDPDRELWLFGDSFVSRPGRRTRAGSTMVANTIAISSCRSGKWSIEYHWRASAQGHKARRKRAFFDSGTHAFRYWPLDGFLYQKTLYVALLRVETTNPRKPFGFKLIGVDLAKVANPDAPPDQWSITYTSLSKSRAAFPGVSIVLLAPYAYFFGVMERDANKRQAVILTRISLDHLARPAESLEYLAAGGKWKPAPIQADADDLVAQGQADFSVRYHRKMAKWVMLLQQPGFRSGQVGVSTAANLDGPWSPFRSLMNEPEMHARRSHRKRIFCYAAKEHPSFESTPGTLLVTYTCNSLHFKTLVSDMSIYRPIVTQLQMH